MLQILNNPFLTVIAVGAGLFAITYGTIGFIKLLSLIFKNRPHHPIPMILDPELKAKYMEKYGKKQKS